MPNAFRSARMVDNENSSLYVISESPDSGAIAFLQNGLNERSNANHHFQLPQSSRSLNYDYPKAVSFWDDKSDEKIDFELKSNFKNTDIFLFFSGQINLNNQFESLVFLLEENQTFELIRIITFLDARALELGNPKLVPWINANAHFSDAICFFNRSNRNASLISNLIKQYDQLRYPLETYLIPNSSTKHYQSILNSTVKRISHAFDPVDILEAEDTPLSDPYLKKLSNGNREKPIPRPFDF